MRSLFRTSRSCDLRNLLGVHILSLFVLRFSEKMDSVTKKNPRYNYKFELEMVLHVQKSDKTVEEIACDYNVPSNMINRRKDESMEKELEVFRGEEGIQQNDKKILKM